jgi:alpha-glucosidase
MQKIIQHLLLVFPLLFPMGINAETCEVSSPGGQWTIRLDIDNGVRYEIKSGETQLIAPSPIALNLSDGRIIGAGTVKSTETNSVNRMLPVPIGKNKEIGENYNELIIHFNEGYDLLVRAYNEGIAYRWISALDGNIIIDSEDFVFNFPANPQVYFPEATNLEHWEKSYTNTTVNDLRAGKYAVTPILFASPGTNYKIAIAESDLFDYPGLYIQTNGNNSMK